MAKQVTLADAAAQLSEHFKRAGEPASMSERELILGARRMLRLLAAPLLEQMGLAGSPDSKKGESQDDKDVGSRNEAKAEPVALLDAACGTGVVTQEVQAAMGPTEMRARSRFVCADSSPAMVELVRKRAMAEGWENVEACVADATNSQLESESFTHVAAALALHLIPDPDAAVADCWRVLRPGGVFGATTFPRANGRMFWWPDMRAALSALLASSTAATGSGNLPEVMPMQMHDCGQWDDAAWIEQHLSALEYGEGKIKWQQVSVKKTAGVFRVEGAEEWVAIFGTMMPFLIKTYWDDETRQRYSLEEVRDFVRGYLEEKYEGRGWDVEFEVLSMTAVKP